MTVRTDAIDLLTAEHRKVESLFAEYEAATDPAEQTKVVHRVVHDLAVHGEIEELLLYPRARQALPDGESLADEAVEEHLAIKQTLNDLDSMTAEDEGFADKMAELMREVRHHVEEEESDLFPKLREALTEEERAELGGALEAARTIVPTRPHPSAPTGPIGKLAASPPVALVDRVRDAVRGWADNRS
jgi:hemerythrin superfamily protein